MPPGGGMRGGHGGHYMTEEEKAAQPKITPQLVIRALSYLKPYWVQLALVLLCIAVSSIFGLLPSILTGKIIDEGLIARDMRKLVLYVAASFGVTLAANLIGVAESYMNTWIAQHITYDMRNQMFRHLQKMAHRFYTDNNQGDIITRMTSDIDGVESVITNTFKSILSNSITLVFALAAMFQKNWILAAIEPIIKERTSILIAHRLSTILAADEIYVLKDGRIAEHGQHKDLVKAGGVYTELYNTQFHKIEDMTEQA